MKRRVPERGGGEVPPELLRFVYADWADEDADGPPPPYWRADGEGMWFGIRAHRRYLEAVRAWRAERDLSYDDWRALQASHGIGVAVER